MRRRRRGIGLDEHGQRVGIASVGDPHLRSIYDVVITVQPRGGADALQVRARVRLGQADAGAPPPRGEIRQVRLLLFGGAMHGDHLT